MMHIPKILTGLWLALLITGHDPVSAQDQERAEIAAAMEKSIKSEILNPWYPRSLDKEHGGFLSAFTFDFKPADNQDKMIVTQSRHVWTNAKASLLFPQISHYRTSAEHGYKFLRDVMWDKQHGGFHTLVDREGHPKESGFAPKEAYGNAFALYALAAYYHALGDTAALNLAKRQFHWLEKHSHDPVHKGYYQHMAIDGTPEKRKPGEPSTSVRAYKDQNTSIHILEALTELYVVWPDPLVRERLQEMLVLIRDKITTPKGHLTLFLEPDWTPVTFADSSEAVVLKHRNVDHVSFGHDVETAYLMIEASHVLGTHDDETTMKVAKRMVDHALRNGWDNDLGGLYDEGYYFKGDEDITIIRDTKNWWAQAEALNTLLLMADLYPHDEMEYFEKFKMLWAYAQKYLIDHEYGDWYAGGLDKEPHHRRGLKGHIWKAAYHQYRSLANCIQRLPPDAEPQLKLADPNATKETKALFENLAKLSENHTLFGHQHATEYGHGWSGEDDRSDVKSVTGSHPAVIGVDLMGFSGRPEDAIRDAKEALKKNVVDTYNRGGVTTVAWHFSNPVSKGGFYWVDSLSLPAVKYIIPGGEAHDKYKDILDGIGEWAHSIRGADGQLVPLIFRPYHEFDGGWFWWGKPHCTREEFITLWRFTVSYLRDSLEVHNFIYAFSPDNRFLTEEQFLERYPGDEWVDMVGMDNYGDMGRDRYAPEVASKKLKIVSDYAQKAGKLAAFTETGLESIPNTTWWTEVLLKVMRADPEMKLAYVLVWRNDVRSPTHYYAPFPDHPSVPDFKKFYDDPYTLFENDLKNIYR